MEDKIFFSDWILDDKNHVSSDGLQIDGIVEFYKWFNKPSTKRISKNISKSLDEGEWINWLIDALPVTRFRDLFVCFKYSWLKWEMSCFNNQKDVKTEKLETVANMVVEHETFNGVDRLEIEKVIARDNYTGQVAIANRRLGVSRNLGDFNHVRIDVAITVPGLASDFIKLNSAAAKYCDDEVTKTLIEYISDGDLLKTRHGEDDVVDIEKTEDVVENESDEGYEIDDSESEIIYQEESNHDGSIITEEDFSF